jgi:glycerol-3-phosphate dehydrogenase (NAD(P)+)
MENRQRVAVLGAGCWGVALALLLNGNGHDVSMWEISRERSDKLNKLHELEFLPGISIPEEITATPEMEKAVSGREIIVFAVPSHFVRGTAKMLAGVKKDLGGSVIVNAAKGIETETLKRMSEIIHEELPSIGDRICTVSGPSFAREVAKRIPTAVVMAGSNPKAADNMQRIFSSAFFRVYSQRDIAGAEIGGSLKNIIAIACGMSDGLGFGDNTKAALVTRGLRELVRIGVKLGGEPKTFYGLSGIGDLMLTCFSRQSRNRLFGEKIGNGKNIETALGEVKTVVEGYRTAKSVHALGEKNNLELPIINETYEVLYNGKKAKDTISSLMRRELKSETQGMDF